ncbi:MAG: carbohydrate binding family 9 domain-containing protein, partial [Ignavibacteria bacterium]|nr:carbohydrate binding family 9 domain-containing protein [Ignavibacteria bacterium]
MKYLLSIFLLFFVTRLLFPQTEADSIIFIPNSNKSVTPAKVLGNDISIDGKLNETEWRSATVFTNFSQVEPGDNVKPSVETDAYIFYNNYALYVAFVCHETDIKSLRKTFTERDKAFQDDWVGIFLDTYFEGKQAYELIVNPYGIQSDLMWSATGGEDENYDIVWKSAAEIYKEKWIVEMEIPFKSIRFPDKNEQSWNFHLIRNRPREVREQISWTSISRDDPSLYTNPGKLTGLKGLKGGENFEVLPYVLGSQSGFKSDYGNADSEFKNEKVTGEVGINLKYGITSNLTADATVNPDFSQIESDAAQIDVNNTYALFYPEKRPFFIEGSNIFLSPMQNIYTRSINNPLFAAKLTGKVGKLEMGFISAYDQKSPFIIPFTEYSDYLATGRKSLSNILRLKYSVSNDDSYLGFIFTDREVNKESNKFLDVDGYNRVAGFDGSLRFWDQYLFTFQWSRFFSKEINYPEYENTGRFDNGKYTSALDGESFAGNGTVLKINRSARHWNFELSYDDISPVARRDNGFIYNNDIRRLETWQGYTMYPEGKIVDRIEPSAFGMLRYTYDGKIMEQFAQASLWMRLVNQINVNATYFLFNNEYFAGKFLEDARRFSINVNANSFDWLYGGFFLSVGKSIVRDEDNPRVGHVNNIELWGTVKPIDRLTLDNSWSYYELLESSGGSKIYAGYIFRN